MMLLAWTDKLERHLRHFINNHFEICLERLVVEKPPRTELGDVAFPFPFILAKRLRRPPRIIAEEVVKHIPSLEGVERFEAAGAGYLNVFFDRVTLWRDLRDWLVAPPPPPTGEKLIVEHTNINPNKAAHIGHLRNATLGDAFVRLLRARGNPVEVQNYVDNTGVQVADVVVGMEHLRGLSLAQVKMIPEPFDYYCWDLYAEVSDFYREDASRVELRRRTLQAIEQGEGPTAELAEYISSRVLRAHLKTMQRLGVRYDVLPRESEILHLKFWDQAFRLLKETGSISLEREGPNQDCWVMQIPEADGPPAHEKIIVRSDGTVTYVGKDIAYQLWKFGLLGKTFHYRPFHRYADGHVVWVSSTSSNGEEPPSFGGGQRVFNVIDVRQSYLQRIVIQGLRKLGYDEQANRSTHYSYEMVALSPTCCRELGIELSDQDRRKPYIEVSGRKGLGVKADDLIDRLIERSLKEVASRQRDLPLKNQQQIAEQIAVGALRYFLLKYTRNTVIAFDFAQALSFEGETGPYLQYTVVRANNIFRKLKQRGQSWQPVAPDDFGRFLSDNDTWALLLTAAGIDETMEQSARTLELSHLAKKAFLLAQQFNLFYHQNHILSETDLDRRNFYLSIAQTACQSLVKTMGILGIDVPERM